MQKIIHQIKQKEIPSHIGIIMDGNGRWAQKKGLPRIFGHKNSITAIKESIKTCVNLDISFLSLYVFSKENYQKRPAKEKEEMIDLLIENLKSQLEELQKNKVRVLILGQPQEIPSKELLENLENLRKKTSLNKGITLIILLNYSSKSEIINTCKKIAQKVLEGTLSLEEINEVYFEKNLSTENIPPTEIIPPIDLIIRSGGEKRLSNFPLWESAYAELHFTETLWPDFRKEDLLQGICDYQNRERRFGGLKV